MTCSFKVRCNLILKPLKKKKKRVTRGLPQLLRGCPTFLPQPWVTLRPLPGSCLELPCPHLLASPLPSRQQKLVEVTLKPSQALDIKSHTQPCCLVSEFSTLGAPFNKNTRSLPAQGHRHFFQLQHSDSRILGFSRDPRIICLHLPSSCHVMRVN